MNHFFKNKPHYYPSCEVNVNNNNDGLDLCKTHDYIFLTPRKPKYHPLSQFRGWVDKAVLAVSIVASLVFLTYFIIGLISQI